MYDKILVPLDGSAHAEKALTFATALAKHHGSQLLLLQAVQARERIIDPFGEIAYLTITTRDRRRGAEADRYVATLCRGLGYEKADYLVQPGEPVPVIAEIQVSQRADLIVMSTHGRSGIDRLVFGSVTEKVLQQAQSPVWIVRHTRPLRRILVPLDGSTLSEAIVPHVAALAGAFAAEVILLNVRGRGDPPVVDYFDKVRAEIAPHAVKTTCLSHLGDPAELILIIAGAYNVDMIAMSTHGYSGLSRLRFGSVTEKILHEARRSMLIVRPWL